MVGYRPNCPRAAVWYSENSHFDVFALKKYILVPQVPCWSVESALHVVQKRLQVRTQDRSQNLAMHKKQAPKSKYSLLALKFSEEINLRARLKIYV